MWLTMRSHFIRRSNQRAGGKGGFASLFHAVPSWPALPQHDRWAENSIAFTVETLP